MYKNRESRREELDLEGNDMMMMMGGKTKTMVMAIISKMYCWSSERVLVVRRRPHVVNGGGFVVTDCTTQQIVFRVDGCGILGSKGELILRDHNGDALLLIRRKGGMVEALSIYRKWKGYSLDYEGSKKPVFRLKEPNYSACFVKNNAIRICTDEAANKNITREKGSSWDFEIRGYFPDKDCSIVDSKGSVIAQVGVKKEVEKLMESKDLYHVIVKPGIDQAFVLGIIGVLDYIYGESTYC